MRHAGSAQVPREWRQLTHAHEPFARNGGDRVCSSSSGNHRTFTISWMHVGIPVHEKVLPQLANWVRIAAAAADDWPQHIQLRGVQVYILRSCAQACTRPSRPRRRRATSALLRQVLIALLVTWE